MTALKDHNNKWSMTRIFVAACAIVGLLMAIGSGFNFYTPPDAVFLSVFGAATGALIGKGFERK